MHLSDKIIWKKTMHQNNLVQLSRWLQKNEGLASLRLLFVGYKNSVYFLFQFEYFDEIVRRIFMHC